MVTVIAEDRGVFWHVEMVNGETRHCVRVSEADSELDALKQGVLQICNFVGGTIEFHCIDKLRPTVRGGPIQGNNT